MPSYEMIKQGMKAGSNLGPKKKKGKKKKAKVSMQKFFYSGKHRQ